MNHLREFCSLSLPPFPRPSVFLRPSLRRHLRDAGPHAARADDADDGPGSQQRFGFRHGDVLVVVVSNQW